MKLTVNLKIACPEVVTYHAQLGGGHTIKCKFGKSHSCLWGLMYHLDHWVTMSAHKWVFGYLAKSRCPSAVDYILASGKNMLVL